MPPTYYWKTPEDAAFLFLILGCLGIIQIYLSYLAAYTLFIPSPLVLAFVPLGVVLAQATSAAVLANVLARWFLPQRRQRQSRAPRPIREYLRRFMVLLLAMFIVLAIWGGFYGFYLYLTHTALVANLVRYIIGNTAGAILALVFATIFDWLFAS